MVQKYSKSDDCDCHAKETSSGRTALHKAAFWGHSHIVPFLVKDCSLDVNVLDSNGDTALNDAARFGHVKVVEQLLEAGTDATIKNKEGQNAMDVAAAYDQEEVSLLLTQAGLTKSIEEIKAAPLTQTVDGQTCLSEELSGKVIEALLDQIDTLQAK